MTTTPNVRDVNLYEVLGLPPPSSGVIVSTHDVKIAFRRALLLHHPDKAKSSAANNAATSLEREESFNNQPSSRGFSPLSQNFSVDEIRLARQILSDPAKRQKYDRDLINNALTNSHNDRGLSRLESLRPTELETIDLDDLDYDAGTSTWMRKCRCGNERAFEITEEDLEYESASGSRELIVSCSGCSLHIRVTFEAVEDEG